MKPRDQSQNDNRSDPALKWEDTPFGKRVMLCVSLVVIAAGTWLSISVLEPRHWLWVGLMVGATFVVVLIGGLYRLIVHGRT
ncbi:UNVERIFIED_CONTAM: hypothetical protein Q9R58_12335 [Methylobacteriaceae bacterium AG10]|nr:hypothetical protein [Methylobacteriaceae bacterium AG10]